MRDRQFIRRLAAKIYDFLVVGGPARIGIMTLTMRCSIGEKAEGAEWKDKSSAAFGTNLVASIRKTGQSAVE